MLDPRDRLVLLEQPARPEQRGPLVALELREPLERKASPGQPATLVRQVLRVQLDLRG